jgi:hypothetical protein
MANRELNNTLVNNTGFEDVNINKTDSEEAPMWSF